MSQWHKKGEPRWKLVDSLNWGDRIGSLGKLKEHLQHRVLEKRVVHKAVILEMGKRSSGRTRLSTEWHMHMGKLLKDGERSTQQV